MTLTGEHTAYHFHADAKALQEMRQWLDETLTRFDIAPEQREQLVLAVNEACMNVIQHAYGEQATGEIRLHITAAAQRLTIELEDDAPAIDTTKVKPRALSDVRPGGLGVHFIREIMDEMEFLPCGGKGNLLRLVKHLHEAG
jgi:anti-sigma regulatory factor (Ser/Thr protein kinase)